MKNTERFVDTGKLLTTFADEVLVNCINCSTLGIVKAIWAPYKWSATFECSNCHFALSSETGHWVGAVRLSGRQRCGYCGHKWLTPTISYDAPPIEPQTQLVAECPKCVRQTSVKVSLARAFPDDKCCDPHFGLPLTLAIHTRHGTVWAYNRKHLNELMGYITAKLRVRQNSGNSACSQWMKLAKHREEITKALCKLNTMT